MKKHYLTTNDLVHVKSW